MSTAVPVVAPSIPHPDGTPEGNYQSILNIKQNIELSQGTRGTAYSARLHGPTTVDTALAAALRKVS